MRTKTLSKPLIPQYMVWLYGYASACTDVYTLVFIRIVIIVRLAYLIAGKFLPPRWAGTFSGGPWYQISSVLNAFSGFASSYYKAQPVPIYQMMI